MWLFMCALVLLPGWVWAYTLTDADYQKLKTDITVTHQAEFSTAVANNDDKAISDAYGLVAVPDFWIWRTQLGEKEIYEATSVDNTTWNWATYKSQEVQARDSR